MLAAFKSYLLDTAHIKDKYVPHHLKWVSDCYSFINESTDKSLDTDQNKGFVAHIPRDHGGWQVKRAHYALRLYSFFLSREAMGKPGISSQVSDAWPSIEEGTRRALRLRHRSLTTETPYVGWLRQFRGFVQSKLPACPMLMEAVADLTGIGVTCWLTSGQRSLHK